MRANKLDLSRAKIIFSIFGCTSLPSEQYFRNVSFAPGYILITLPHCYLCSDPYLDLSFSKVRAPT